jgi:hypothetical protein
MANEFKVKHGLISNGTITPLNSADFSPLNLTPRSSAPTTASVNDIYLDDGTNTINGNHGLMRCVSTGPNVWADVSIDANIRNHSTGAVVKPTITDNVDGTIDLGTDGVFNYMTTADGASGNIVRLNASTGADDLALTDLSPNYLYSNYNSGSPIYAVTTNANDFLSDFRKVPVARIYRDGNVLHILEYDLPGILLANKSNFKDIVLNCCERQGGLALSTAATRISTIAAGTAWFSTELYNLAENEAGTSGVLYEYYPVSGVWNSSVVTSYDSTYYSDGTDRQALAANKYVAKYFFRGVEDENHAYFIHGNTQNTLATALAEPLPATPGVITSHALYVGKIIIQQGATNGVAYPRAWGEALVSSGAVNHDDADNIYQAGTGVTNGHISDQAQTIAGAKTFSSFPITPSSEPTTNYQVANKKYVDDIINDGWIPLIEDTDWNDQAPSTSTITMSADRTADIRPGSPIKFTLSGTTYYAICTAITSNLLTIAGAPLTTGDGDLQALWFGPTNKVDQIDILIDGQFADAADSTLIANDLNSAMRWFKGEAYIVQVNHIVGQEDSGATNPNINVTVDGSDVITSDDAVANSWQNTVVDINTSNYQLSRLSDIEITSDAAGTNDDASDLTVSLVIVYA